MTFPMRPILIISLAIIAARIIASIMTPTHVSAPFSQDYTLEDMVPKTFKGWALDPTISTIQPNEEGSLQNRIYDQSIARGYRDENGYLIMLVIAYGHNQSDMLQLHRPEVCYVANGFKIISNNRQDIPLTNYPDTSVPSRRLHTWSSIRSEPVTYWTRIGNSLPTSTLSRQVEKLMFGLSGSIPDGILVRVSSISDKPQDAYKMHDRFINDLLGAIEEKNINLFLGQLTQNFTNINDTKIDEKIK